MLVQTRFISGEADSGMNSSGLRLSSCPGQILVVASNGVSGVCAAFFRFVRQENVAERRGSTVCGDEFVEENVSKVGEQLTVQSLQVHLILLNPLRKVQQGWKQQ